jgi:Fic family protein
MSIPLNELNFEHAVNYHYDMFPPTTLDYAKIVHQLVSATDAIARFDQMLKKMHNSEILLAPLRNQEAVISSRMEGTISTMDEILKYEADYNEGEDTSSSTRSDVIETVLYQRALKASQQALSDGYPLSEHLIKAAHEKLLSFGRGAAKTPGKYKTEQNYLVDRTKRNVLFTPIAPITLHEGLEKLFAYIQNSTDPVLVKTAVSHVEFEALHPFKDGNGRIGRMLITLMLWVEGVISAPHFYISGYFEKNKDEYIDMMRNVSSSNNWTEWVVFFLKAIEQQAIRNLTIAENISNLYDRMKNEFSEALSSRFSVQALDYVFTNPVFRNNKFTQNSGIPSQTASRFTRVLVEKDLLRILEEPSGRRAALFVFEPLMELVRV